MGGVLETGGGQIEDPWAPLFRAATGGSDPVWARWKWLEMGEVLVTGDAVEGKQSAVSARRGRRRTALLLPPLGKRLKEGSLSRGVAELATRRSVGGDRSCW